MIRFEASEWDRAGLLPSIIHAPYLLTTNVVRSSGDARSRLISPPHSHPDAMLAWCPRGAVQVHTRDAFYRLTPQQALWIPPGTPHTAHHEDDAIACFTYVPIHALFREVSEVTPAIIPRAAEEMLLFLDGDGIESDLRLTFQRALIELLQTTDSSRPASGFGRIPLPSDPRVRELVDQVLADPGSRSSLADLSRAHRLHERTVARIFSDDLGLTFGRWRTTVRMVQAMRLLREGISISTIAALCGYDSASAFSAAFKAHTGSTPRACRKRDDSRPHLDNS